MQEKTCSRCKILLSVRDFYPDIRSKDGLYSSCKFCSRQTLKKWRTNNPDYVAIPASKEVKQKWIDSHPEKMWIKSAKSRAKRAGCKVFEISEDDVRKLWATPCLACGNKNVIIEHNVPLSKGGDHGMHNLQSLCTPCNVSKGKFTIDEWKLLDTPYVKKVWGSDAV